MRQFNFEIGIEDSDQIVFSKIIQIQAEYLEDALQEYLLKYSNDNEYIYQVTTDIGIELPQPCFDFTNGTNIYRNLYPELFRPDQDQNL